MKKSFAQILGGLDEGMGRKIAAKLPSWDAAGCEVPVTLALEQCSSEATARYKASLIGEGCGRLADLTGGLGVDCHAFYGVAGEVLYFEHNALLAETARSNFAKLGAANISVRCAETGTEFLRNGELPSCDWIYLDPARRDGCGRKVFLLEDCTPNVLEMLPELWEHTEHIMIKLSPMADIAMVTERLGRRLREIRIVGFCGEVKELLCLLDRDHDGPHRVIAALVDADGHADELDVSALRQESVYAEPHPGQILFEPSGVLLKAGAFHLEGLAKLAPSTHLFVESGVGNPYARFGKSFRINEVLPFGKAGFREIQARYPQAEVTARNIPMTSDELRARLKLKSGGDKHIFAVSTLSSRLILVCERSRSDRGLKP